MTRNTSVSSNSVVAEPWISICTCFAIVVIIVSWWPVVASVVPCGGGRGGDTRGMPSFSNVAGSITSIQSRDDVLLG